MPKRQPIPIEEIKSGLQEKLPESEVEQDGEWLWLVKPEVGPVHAVKGGCQCEQCKDRAAKREVVKSLNFIFAFRPHKLKSGKESRWGNSAMAPRPFHRKKSKPSTNNNNSPIVPAIKEEDSEIEEGVEFFKD